MPRTRLYRPVGPDASHEEIVKGAIEAMDRMRSIVTAEMIVHGYYVAPYYRDQERVEAPCGGHQACAVGSLYLSAGCGVSRARGEFDLPGAMPSNRDEYMEDKPSLRMAYDALNEAAADYIARHGIETEKRYSAPLEDLFESQRDESINRVDLLRVIGAAKRNIKASA